ncbi:MAG: hypothetical protein LBD17_06465 [Endomicrobium sp.]|jgi:hypothetical protein|nr:hypothetical protein [Endomicrobium sp.]
MNKIVKYIQILFVIFLMLSYPYQSNALESPDLKFLNPNRDAISIVDSKGNKFLGYVDWQTIDKSSNLYDIYIYEKYAIIQYNYDDVQKEDSIVCYLFDKNINFIDYENKGNRIFYQSCEDERWHVLGVTEACLFLDGGTAPTVRKLKVTNLISKESIYNGTWYHIGDKIEVLNKTESVVYKLESSVKVGEDSYNHTLHAFALNLHNGEIRDLGNTVSFIGN